MINPGVDLGDFCVTWELTQGMTTPGVHVAIHSSARVLSAAAWLDFAEHVRKLVDQGLVLEARTLWDSVFEVIHEGCDPEMAVLEVAYLPCIRRIPCSATPCTRCEQGRGGFVFPWVGIWTRRAVLAFEGETPQQVWARYHATPDERCDLLACAMVASGRSLEDFVPLHFDRLVSRIRLGRDGWGYGQLFAAWRAWQHGHELFQEPWSLAAVDDTNERAVAGTCIRLLLGAAEAELEWIPGPCCFCGLPRWTRCPRCDRWWCDDCRGDEPWCIMCMDDASFFGSSVSSAFSVEDRLAAEEDL